MLKRLIEAITGRRYVAVMMPGRLTSSLARETPFGLVAKDGHWNIVLLGPGYVIKDLYGQEYGESAGWRYVISRPSDPDSLPTAA